MDALQSIDSQLVSYYNDLLNWFHSAFTPGSGFATTVRTFHIFLFILALFFLFVIAYSFIRILEIRKKEHEHLHHEIAEYMHKHAEEDRSAQSVSENKQWEIVLGHLFSENASDWKLAIMEADNMLDNLMTELGFKGESLGEKLKGADQEKFKYLTQAWEVHTVRNRIAHEGLAFEVSQHEAKRVIAIYEQIFHQYGYI